MREKNMKRSYVPFQEVFLWWNSANGFINEPKNITSK